VLSLAVYLRIIVPLYRAHALSPPGRRPLSLVGAIALALTVALGLGLQALIGLLI